MQNNYDYDYKKTLRKIVKYLLIVATPFVLTEYPEIANLTISGAMIALLDYLKHGNK